jgi:hypothetical protein
VRVKQFMQQNKRTNERKEMHDRTFEGSKWTKKVPLSFHDPSYGFFCGRFFSRVMMQWLSILVATGQK